MHDLRLLFLELRVRCLLYPCFKENRGIMLLDLQLIEKCTNYSCGAPCVYSCGAPCVYSCGAPCVYSCGAPWHLSMRSTMAFIHAEHHGVYPCGAPWHLSMRSTMAFIHAEHHGVRMENT